MLSPYKRPKAHTTNWCKTELTLFLHQITAFIARCLLFRHLFVEKKREYYSNYLQRFRTCPNVIDVHVKKRLILLCKRCRCWMKTNATSKKSYSIHTKIKHSNCIVCASCENCRARLLQYAYFDETAIWRWQFGFCCVHCLSGINIATSSPPPLSSSASALWAGACDNILFAHFVLHTILVSSLCDLHWACANCSRASNSRKQID